MHSFWRFTKSLKGVLAKFYVWTGPQIVSKISQNPEISMYFYKKQFDSHHKKSTKRNVSLFSSFRGSITVEAAIVLPLFLFFCIQIISVVCLFEIHSAVTMALHQEVSSLSLQAYAYEEMGIDSDSMLMDTFGDIYLKKKVIERIGKTYLDSSMIEGGSSGIQIQFGEEEDTQDVISITLSYRIKPIFGIMGFSGFPMSNRCTMKAWTGYRQPIDTQNEKEEEELVYITENGNVYHKSRQCTHLTLSIREVERKSLEVLRNEEGGKYYACERCGDGQQKTVFLTEEGNRYHTSLMCSGLKRTIYVIKLSEAGGRRACSRCGGM